MRPKTFIIRHFVIHLILLVLTVASVSKGLAAQEKLTRTKAQKEQPQTNQVIKSELEGTVEVSFKIDNGGKVQILEMNATSQALADYVIKKLNKIQLEKSDYNSGQIIKYRFVFKKQA
jgi:hypothetical protein